MVSFSSFPIDEEGSWRKKGRRGRCSCFAQEVGGVAVASRELGEGRLRRGSDPCQRKETGGKNLSCWSRGLPEVRKGVGVGRRGRVRAAAADLVLQYLARKRRAPYVRESEVRIVALLRKSQVQFVLRVTRKLATTIGVRWAGRSDPPCVREERRSRLTNGEVGKARGRGMRWVAVERMRIEGAIGERRVDRTAFLERVGR